MKLKINETTSEIVTSSKFADQNSHNQKNTGQRWYASKDSLSFVTSWILILHKEAKNLIHSSCFQNVLNALWVSKTICRTEFVENLKLAVLKMF